MDSEPKKAFGIENRTKYFSRVLFFLLLLSVAAFGLVLSESRGAERGPKAGARQHANPFGSVQIEAKSALVWDVVNRRELFSKNPNVPLPLASLTKLMTAVVSEEKTADGAQVEITKEDLGAEGDSRLVVGDIWKAKDLRDFTLVTSSNDGALALAAVASSFVDEMNGTARKIGLSNSRFFNEHGLDVSSSTSGGYGSAKDVTALFEYVLKNHPDIMEATRYKSLEFKSGEKTYDAENTNVVIDRIPNLIASKTGYTELAGGNLVVAFDAGLERPIIVSVLGSTEQGRFDDVLKLVKASLNFIRQ